MDNLKTDIGGLHNIQQAAEALGIAERTVRRWCAELGFKKLGRDWLLTADQVEQVRAHAQDGPGRPRKK